ncbi:DUF4326 domain-containing protein [Puniceibacterium confluentis]|uniref:DUF4326 domain-containing protein n=1 Tax=Puniceibacterium confluentis TaxID=1958944 RepID=UPI0011B447A8|nr:DUF4326 domain-containing protein [Puniceibacterium confluentis]
MADPSRILLCRTKGWRKPPEARVVARNTIFGNPWVVGADGAYCWPRGTRAGWQSSHRTPAGRLTAEQAVGAFAVWIHGYPVPVRLRPDILPPTSRRRWRDDMQARRAAIWQALSLGELRGLDLCCWCATDATCHADVLLALAADTRADLSRWMDLVAGEFD